MAGLWWENLKKPDNFELSVRARHALLNSACPLDTREGAKAFVRNAWRDGTLRKWKRVGPSTYDELCGWAEVEDKPSQPAACETCRFACEWDHEISGLGECHRYPPTMATVTNREGTMETIRPQDGGWSLIQAFDWCGEHQPKPPAP